MRDKLIYFYSLKRHLINATCKESCEVLGLCRVLLKAAGKLSKKFSLKFFLLSYLTSFY